MYDAEFTTVTDQAGKVRRSKVDALGRLLRVDEPTVSGGLGTTSSPNQPTSYTYDVFGNLRTVTQSTQTRTFTYDSLSRLRTAINPESGTVTYTYDDNSNLWTKTDSRSPAVTTTFAYDALNRATTRTYSDSTPAVTYAYDSTTITNGKGRLASVTSTVSTYSYGGYDGVGRVLGGTQTIGAQSYSMGQTYDLAGHVKTMTYPSNRTVNYSYDNAGRLSTFTGNLGDGTLRNYATGISYGSNGAWTRERFGTTTALYNKRFYNSRQQLYGMFVSTVNDDANWNRGAIVNYYSLANYGFGTAGSDTNGNLYVQQHWVPADDAVSSSTFMQQNYDYDELNRLKWVGEYLNGASQSGSQNYSFDRWGNRTISSASGTGINNKAFTVNTANNRLTVPGGQTGTMAYDAVGNLTTDTYSGAAVTRAYDGENRMVSETQGGGLVAGTYAYNGDGQRVKRTVAGTPSPVETWQVYGLGGELLAEYAANGAAASPQKEYGYRNGEMLITAEPSAAIKWLVTDQLGTPRMIVDLTGSLSGVKRHDYLPFGEELYAGTGNRSLGGGYSGDNVRQKFTSKERDNETGFDYFLARYYSSLQGRFTGVDPLMASAQASLPQSWNRYSYSFNNPLAFIDPDGRRAVPDDYYADRDGQITIDETTGRTDRFHVQNSDGTYTQVATLQRNNAGLVQFPDNGTGFNRYGTVDAGGQDRATGESVGQGDHFLQPVVAAALFGTLNVLNSDHQLTVSLGDMSSSNGSDPWQPGGRHHAGHGHNGNRSGLDIDFRYLNNNGVSFQSQTARSDAQFSVQNNQTVYDTARTFGFTTNYQGTNRGNNGDIQGVTRAGGHNDHGHLGFNQADANIFRRTMLVTRP